MSSILRRDDEPGPTKQELMEILHIDPHVLKATCIHCGAELDEPDAIICRDKSCLV